MQEIGRAAHHLCIVVDLRARFVLIPDLGLARLLEGLHACDLGIDGSDELVATTDLPQSVEVRRELRENLGRQ